MAEGAGARCGRLHESNAACLIRCAGRGGVALSLEQELYYLQ